MLVLRPVTALADATRCLGEGHLGARTGRPHAAEELGQIAHLQRNGRVAGTAGRFPTHGSPGQGITQTILQPPDAGANPRARRRGGASRPLAPDQLGRIVVARFLELPLRTFERRVCALEQAPCFQALRPLVRLGSLSGQPSLAAESSRIANLLAVIQPASDGVVFRYTNPAFDREYRFEEAALARRLERGDPELTRLVSRLRLVNTRNRLTHALVQALLEIQREYVLTGDPLRLKPLSQAALSAHLRLLAHSAQVSVGGACPVDADPSRISRLMRQLAVQLPNGEVVGLRRLCPKARDLHRDYVAQVIKQERLRMMEDETLVPMTDREIAAAVRRAFGARLLPRTVAYIRRDLGLPNHRERGRRSEYLAATMGFSPLLPLTAEALREHVPPEPGVYEIRHPEAPPGACTIIYIGSARDLSKRLADHLRGYGSNERLRGLLQAGDAWFRYCLVGVNWREAERAVYVAFCATFGAPPSCNRMSP